jgi:hypothetical protein
MATQLGTYIQLNVTGTASNASLLALMQRLVSNAQAYKANLDAMLLALNNLISGATTANIETALGLISGQGTNLFNIVNGASQAAYGTGENSQTVNLAGQVGGP